MTRLVFIKANTMKAFQLTMFLRLPDTLRVERIAGPVDCPSHQPAILLRVAATIHYFTLG